LGGESLLAILVLLNNSLHDPSAAAWLFGTVLLWSILRKKIPEGHTSPIVVDILGTILILMGLSIAGIVVFRVLRTLAYRNYEWSTTAGQGQVMLLITKHVIFTVVFVVGFVYYFRASKLVRKRRNEKAQ
jgi:hypothetical protein